MYYYWCNMGFSLSFSHAITLLNDVVINNNVYKEVSSSSDS